jgi:hypothetical protein
MLFSPHTRLGSLFSIRGTGASKARRWGDAGPEASDGQLPHAIRSWPV